MRRILIKNASIATSKEVFTGSVLVQDERIARIIKSGSLPMGANLEVLDASGLFLLPGGVDPHTHFDLDVGNTRASDDFYTGGVAAACGGTTTVIDHMAFGPEGCGLMDQPAVYHQLAQRCPIDYGFHGVVQRVDSGVLADMQRLVDAGIPSLKLYMTYDKRVDDPGILQVLQRAKELGMTVCVHAEDHEMLTALRQEFVAQGHTQARYHPLSRPAEAEEKAVRRFLELARQAGQPLVYIVHLSTQRGLQALRQARAQGQANAMAETCPQYLLLDDTLYADDREGLKYIMSPPLRKTEDEAALWGGLAEGDIDTVGTDHCPFFFETQKQMGAADFTKCPGGAPGVELRMPLLFSEGFVKGRLTLPQVVRLCCTRPAEIFGLAPQKGDLCEGADADLVLFDPDITWQVTKTELHENVDYTPYEGMQLQGRPVLTMSRGEVIAQNGAFTAQAGRGRFLARRAAK